MRRSAAALFALAVALAGCARPPPDAYMHVGGGASGGALDVGQNAAHEACTLQTDDSGGRIYCGTYLQPAGHVLKDAQAPHSTGASSAAAQARPRCSTRPP
jgi:hypothetical protein